LVNSSYARNAITNYIYADGRWNIIAKQSSTTSRIHQLQTQKDIAQEQQMTAEMNENAAMNWGMWGPEYGMGGFY
jgi:hypothetical protein